MECNTGTPGTSGTSESGTSHNSHFHTFLCKFVSGILLLSFSVSSCSSDDETLKIEGIITYVLALFIGITFLTLGESYSYSFAIFFHKNISQKHLE